MKTITTDTGIELLLPVVPRDATKFNIVYSPIGNKFKEGYELNYQTEGVVPNGYQDIPNGNYKLLGTVHYENGKHVLSEGFDSTPLVENNGMGCWVDYVNQRPDNKFTLLEPADSFISLLQREGKYWVNPYGETFKKNTGNSSWIDDLHKWHAAESLKLREDQMIVIIQKL